ncbi:unnamed protein product [Rangifer tarandus platyrhynchus]|uniref:Cyclin C-terminal domain-containing protein n=1 Tax=Rangifer tarandus platyrhynchus TaxID=3082113 RepID=A0ABN8ZB73_RANTA|nr:unnamed protein product [Rangifer tarandus platyrhynchus]CAI9689101.1 unnamed protein product [Rangifer tarandus platyrhynchus]
MKEENLCQAFSDALLCKIEDIDTEDWENPQLCSDYMKDIYQYLRQLEVVAATSCLSQKVLSQGKWNLKQQYYTGYIESEVMRYMAKNIGRVNKNVTRFTTIKNKYTSSKLLKISTIPQLNSKAIQELASPLLGQS